MALQTAGRGCTTLRAMDMHGAGREPETTAHDGRSTATDRSAAPADILVFERTSTGFALIGGSGRGAGWAGIVDIPDGDRSLVDRSWRRGAPLQAGSAEALGTCERIGAGLMKSSPLGVLPIPLAFAPLKGKLPETAQSGFHVVAPASRTSTR